MATDADWSVVPDRAAERERDNHDNSQWQGEVEEICQLLADADQPLRRRDVQLECHHTEASTRRRLNYLIEQDHVERVRDDDDGRVVRYALVGEDDDGDE